MLNASIHKAGTWVRMVDPHPEYDLTHGRLYMIEYWDGSSVHITDDAGCGCTLWNGRFEPT